MKTRFRTLIKISDDNKPEAFYIPALKYHQILEEKPTKPTLFKRLNAAGDEEKSTELELFKRLGPTHYLEDTIPLIIQAKKDLGEKVVDPSTTALMTQGLSELNGPTHSYDLYFVNDIKQIKPSNTDGIAIVIAGEYSRRTAFLISNNRFHIANNQRWSYYFSLNPEQLAILEKIPFSTTEPTKITSENILALDALKKEITGVANWIYLGKKSHQLDIYLVDREHRRCNFFAKVMPTFTRVSMLIRFGVSTLLNLGLADSMENPLFPDEKHTIINMTTGNSTDIFTPNPYLRPFNFTQTILGFGMMLVFIFAGQRARTLTGLGLQMDDAFINLYDKLCGPKKPKKSKKTSKKCDSLETKIALAKALFFILILNQMFLMTLWSYLRLTTLSSTIAGAKNSLFSEEMIKIISFTEWLIELTNEPALIIAEAAFIAYFVENYYRPANMLQSINETLADENTKTLAIEYKEEAALKIEISDSLRKPLLVDELEMFGEIKESKSPISTTRSLTQVSSALFSAKNPRRITMAAPIRDGITGINNVARITAKEEKSSCLVM